MKINIFEGVRRIHGVISWCILIGVLIFSFMESPDLTIRYEVPYLGAPPKITEDDCKFADLEEFRFHNTKNGSSYRTSICFRSSKTASGEKLIPYKAAEKGMAYFGQAWSSDVKLYALEVTNSFEPSQEDIKDINSKLWWEKIKLIAKNVGWTMLGLSGFWIVSAMAGWILRGFLGIPTGLDEKPPTA